jgi:hypothetical protein
MSNIIHELPVHTTECHGCAKHHVKGLATDKIYIADEELGIAGLKRSSEWRKGETAGPGFIRSWRWNSPAGCQARACEIKNLLLSKNAQRSDCRPDGCQQPTSWESALTHSTKNVRLPYFGHGRLPALFGQITARWVYRTPDYVYQAAKQAAGDSRRRFTMPDALEKVD